MLELCVWIALCQEKKTSGGEWCCEEGPGCLEYIEYWMFSNCINFNGSRTFFFIFFFDPVEMNPLISKTRAVGQPLMSAAILSLTGRSTEFDLVFSIRVTEEVSLCISLCKKVTVVISSVKAERVTPVSCVGVWCPLKQTQAYFHTKIIHVKIQLATYCSHSICINFRDEWQLQYLKRLAPLPCQWTILYKTNFSIYFWRTGV